MTILHTATHGSLSVIVVQNNDSVSVVGEFNGKQTHMLKSDNLDKAVAYCDGVIDGFKLTDAPRVQELRNSAAIEAEQ